MGFQKLKKELDDGKTRSLYIFTGEERHVMNLYINRISPNPMRAKNLKDIAAHLQSNSLFSTQRTFLLDNDKTVTEWEVEKLLKLIGKNILILTYPAIDNRMKFFKEAKKWVVEFEKFASEQLVAYITKQLDIDPRLANVIAHYSGNQISRIDLECHKLKHLDQEITLELVNELLTPPLEDRIFEMVDAVANKAPAKAYTAYLELMELRESPIKIISLLYTKFKHLFIVQSMYQLQSKEIAEKSGMTPYQVNQVKPIVGQFTLRDVLEYLKMVQKTEVDIKTGKIDIDLGMENLLLTIFAK